MGAAFSNFKETTWPVVAQMYPPKSKFTVDQIPDLAGRVAIVTGGNVGLGYETIKALLQHDAKVYLAARSEEKAKAAISSLKKETGKEAIFLKLDLASLAAVKEAVDVYLSKENELHILFNNAAVMWPPMDELSKDGYDLQWGTNVVGHWYLTELLIPALSAGAKTSPDHHARVITTASSGAYLDTLHFDTFKDGPARRKMSTEALYYQTKHANVVVARQVAKRYAAQGIISISVNPGNLKTELQRYIPAMQRKIMGYTLLYPSSYGALTQLYAGTMPDALNYNGEFMIPWARLGKCRREAYDDEIGDRLWKWLQDEVEAHRG
ncbi:NAD(P)-binding protein [Dichomitus squalens]|uniref:NAD(P)-binding protein n=1 Tax=Dichomitus squalens TaxID=114155 RepID=A0A4Q9PXN9_9APHY|nr:NAD(P)-binding protein [Dichomitus squalens]TBU48025.1 NAD(P)-binding protein [Dichomitus squalens]TBU59421.1 NAD(P)-binding protein [Dichomitus squalens]